VPQNLIVCSLREKPTLPLVLSLLESSKRLIFTPYSARLFRADLNCLVQTAHRAATSAELDKAEIERVLLEMLGNLGQRKNKS